MKNIHLFRRLLMPAISCAQNYSIDWHKIAGGGAILGKATTGLSGDRRTGSVLVTLQ